MTINRRNEITETETPKKTKQETEANRKNGEDYREMKHGKTQRKMKEN